MDDKNYYASMTQHHPSWRGHAGGQVMVVVSNGVPPARRFLSPAKEKIPAKNNVVQTED